MSIQIEVSLSTAVDSWGCHFVLVWRIFRTGRFAGLQDLAV